MAYPDATVHLTPDQFSGKQQVIVESGALSAVSSRFDSGVCGLRLRSDVGELLLLPFQGQQIWSAILAGRELTMRSMFNQPLPTRDFLSTFGGFLQHCGATAMGVPGPDDDHPLHGELPNAPYQAAAVMLGQDERGPYIGLTGTYRHTVAFNYNYIARPQVKLYAGHTTFHVSMTVENLKRTAMSLMYLTHINFRPVDHGRLLYSAPCDRQHMRVRAEVPDSMDAGPGYREFIAALVADPGKHTVLEPGLAFDPEVVLFIDCQADEAGWAHALQVHPDGGADVVRFRPEQLTRMVRWICRTPDQDALGFEPATAETCGFMAEEKKGNVRTLGAKETFHCDLEVGVLSAEETERVAADLERFCKVEG